MADTDTTDNPSIPASNIPAPCAATSDVTGAGTEEVQNATPHLQSKELRNGQDRDGAARKIQRVYRGYRTRRELKGWSLDPTTRWMEAVQEAQWHRSMRVQRPVGGETNGNKELAEEEVEDGESESTSQANPEGGLSPEVRKKWRRVGQVALRAGGDDNIGDKMAENTIVASETRLSETSSGRTVNRKTRQEARRRSTVDTEKTAKMMDLQYFLEMVDVKHRYGSSLRQYHNVWKNSPSKQNFFYWLDYGDGKDFELEQVSRDRLEREQVRYLTREERLDYLVSVDEAGRFRWAKNGERVWTNSERFRDSIKGVVPVEDKTPTFRQYNAEGVEIISESESSSSGESSGEEMKRYLNPDFDEVKGVKKLAYVSPAVIFNHLMQKSLKKRDKWIFVADTSFRLYIGIKESGAFQHSSFLRGARISAAGLIKIKDGQLRSLSPLSGHYRPPAANFRAFVHALQDQGVDMSGVSISRSYAILVGIEGYMKVKLKKKNVEEKISEEKTKILQKAEAHSRDDDDDEDVPEVSRSRPVRKKETTSSDAPPDAESKREVTENKGEEKGGGFFSGLVKTITNRGSKADETESKTVKIQGRGIPGTAPEEGVPAPEGKR